MTLAVPFAVRVPDRIPKQRYYDAEFFALEAERLWPRVWQMACRLEEIPEPDDFVTYEILDQSVVVARTADGGAVAFQNSCRHRGVRLAEGPGTCPRGFVCPFHGWCYGPDGTNTFVPRRSTFSAHNLEPGELDLVPVRCETWGGCAWINLDPDAPPLRASLEPAAGILDDWMVEGLATEWWYACRLPVNWKLGIEAFIEAYHVAAAHPQLVIPTRYGRRDDAAFDARAFVDADVQYLHTMHDGMAGMVGADDVAIAEGLRNLELPTDPENAVATWNRVLNDAVTRHHRERGAVMPDLAELAAKAENLEFFCCFPHYFVLPMYGSATAYRFRPLGPEETLMDIWSLNRPGRGEHRSRPTTPEPWPADDPRWPPIPTQDFANLPRQQRGLHARGFEFLRLSFTMEGHVANFERTIDGFLAGIASERLLPALRSVNTYPFDRPVLDLELPR